MMEPKQVLLVEDNLTERRRLIAKFRRFGTAEFTLTAVQSLGDAITTLEAAPIDVIILDLFLEDTCGLETLVRLRKVSREIPIVVLTSTNDPAQALQAVRRGAQDYLIKGRADWHSLSRAVRYAIERKQAENERRLTEQRFLEMQKLDAVGTLASGVAHNFNNALMVISGHCSLMLLECTDEDENQRHIESIQKATNGAAALTRQLLAFSRQNPTETLIVNLNDIVSDMKILLESVLPVETTLELKLAPHTAVLRADPGQVRQVLMNLVINARNAMPQGGTITIETGWNDDQAFLTVSDTGIGMTQETCARVFEPFFTTKGLALASGLGLSLVYGIVRQQGGSINVASQLGKGSTFSIAFSGARQLQTG